MLDRCFGRLKTIKKNYLELSPKEKWLYVRDAGAFFLGLIGLAVVDPNFKVNWYSYVSAVAILDYTFSLMYTIWYYMDTDPIKGFLAVPLYVGVVIPSAVSYSYIIIDSKKELHQSLALFSGDNIYTNIDRKSNQNYIRLCDKCAMKLLKDTLMSLAVIMSSLFIYSLSPMYDNIFRRELNLLIQILLPTTDVETTLGISLNILNQIFIFMIGGAANCGIEIVACLLKNNVTAITVAIDYAVDELAILIEKPASDLTLAVHYGFRNILIQVQDFDRYILKYGELYYWRFFVHPALGNIAVASSLFLFFFVNWNGGLGLAIFVYGQMYILCDIGNTVDSAGLDLLHSFDKIPWYLLPKEKQLSYAHALNRMQNGAAPRIGPFELLNYETLTNMTKRIYSILAMMNNVMQ